MRRAVTPSVPRPRIAHASPTSGSTWRREGSRALSGAQTATSTPASGPGEVTFFAGVGAARRGGAGRGAAGTEPADAGGVTAGPTGGPYGLVTAGAPAGSSS
ncbi:hypothetical protein GCM10017562_63810 [Streptomyces roseofulvus]